MVCLPIVNHCIYARTLSDYVSPAAYGESQYVIVFPAQSDNHIIIIDKPVHQ